MVLDLSMSMCILLSFHCWIMHHMSIPTLIRWLIDWWTFEMFQFLVIPNIAPIYTCVPVYVSATHMRELIYQCFPNFPCHSTHRKWDNICITCCIKGMKLWLWSGVSAWLEGWRDSYLGTPVTHLLYSRVPWHSSWEALLGCVTGSWIAGCRNMKIEILQFF